MPHGTVKWFNNAKGYGFILSDESGSDIFAHYSAIDMEGYKTLKAGQPVTFDLVEGAKGVHATNIRALTEQGFSPTTHNREQSPSTIQPPSALISDTGKEDCKHDPSPGQPVSAVEAFNH